MTLTHTPASTTSHPERFENEETGWGYSVLQDIDAEDPRTWIGSEHAALWAHHQPRLSHSVAADKPEGNVAIDAFDRFYDEHDAEGSLELTRRYLAVFHPEKKIQIETGQVTGYNQGDWLDMVAAVTEGYGTPASHLDQFGQWAFGDVWVVIPDGKAGISDIYADDAEEALAYFRENFEDDEPTGQESPEVQDSLLGVVVLSEPDYTSEHIARWDCADGVVFANTGTEPPGVRLYRAEERLISDPEQLASALMAAQTRPMNQK